MFNQRFNHFDISNNLQIFDDNSAPIFFELLPFFIYLLRIINILLSNFIFVVNDCLDITGMRIIMNTFSKYLFLFLVFINTSCKYFVLINIVIHPLNLLFPMIGVLLCQSKFFNCSIVWVKCFSFFSCF